MDRIHSKPVRDPFPKDKLDLQRCPPHIEPTMPNRIKMSPKRQEDAVWILRQEVVGQGRARPREPSNYERIIQVDIENLWVVPAKFLQSKVMNKAGYNKIMNVQPSNPMELNFILYKAVTKHVGVLNNLGRIAGVLNACRWKESIPKLGDGSKIACLVDK